jgi:glycosyltransferase involved in cell wall biosynthesis
MEKILKKVLLVGPSPPPYRGIEQFISILLRSDFHNSIKFIHFSTSKPIKRKKEYGGIWKGGVINTILNFYYSFILILKYILVIISNNPEIIHINTSYGFGFWWNSCFLIIGKLFRKKIILHIHGGRFFDNWNNKNKLVKKLISKIINSANNCIVLSHGWKCKFEENLDVQNISVLRNAVSDEFFYNKRYIRNDDKVHLLFVGAIVEAKGIFDLIDALNVIVNSYNIKNVLLTIVGDGDLEHVTSYIKERFLEDYIIVKGPRIKQELIEEYINADIFVLPSWGEGLPFVLLEAMASSLPVVTTKVGAIPELINQGENGYLIKPRDINSLAQSIMHLVSDAELRIKMGVNNYKKIEKDFSLKIMLDNLYRIYMQL